MPLKFHGVEHRAIAVFLSLFLLAALALMSATYPAQAQAQHAGSGKTMYRVINLSDGEHFGDVAINASGQVAFSYTSMPPVIPAPSPGPAWAASMTWVRWAAPIRRPTAPTTTGK